MALRFSGRLSAVQAMPSRTLTFTKSYLYSVIADPPVRGRVTGAGNVYGNILEQAGLGRRTFRIGGFKQQCSGAASVRRLQVCPGGVPAPRRYGISGLRA